MATIYELSGVTGTAAKAKAVDFTFHAVYDKYVDGSLTVKDGVLPDSHYWNKTTAGNPVYCRNRATGHVYKCTKRGAAKSAYVVMLAAVNAMTPGTVLPARLSEWKYVRTDAIVAPTAKVSSLTLARDGSGSRVLRAKWTIPDALKSATSGKRASSIRVTWRVQTRQGIADVTQVKGASATEATLNLDSFDVDAGDFMSNYNPITRQKLYPNGTQQVTSVAVAVEAVNAGGTGPAASVTKAFSVPRPPTISDLAHGEGTGRVSATVTTDAGNDWRERYCTQYEVKVTDTRQGWRDRVVASGSSTSTSIADVGYDVANRFQLDFGQYVKVTVRARARGYAGDSAWVEKSHVVAYPAVATLTKPVVGGREQACSSRQSTGKMTLNVRTNTTWDHPVDHVRLEALVDTTAATGEEAGSAQGWSNVGAVDNGGCTALTCAVGDVYPETRGRRTWVRAKTWHDFEGSFYRRSEPVELTELYTPPQTAADDECSILSSTPGDDGRSMKLLVAWDKKGEGERDDADGTQLAWSDDAGAWTSTDGPDEHLFSWHDAASASADWYFTALITVKGLDEGVLYHFRARRYFDDAEGKRTYGEWSDTVSDMTVTSPGTVVLVAEAPTVERGRGVRFTWAFNADALQQSWRLVTPGGVVVAEGYDPLGSAVVPHSRIAELFGDDAQSMTVFVRMSTGGEPTDSEPVTVAFADPPALSASMAATTDAQPASVSLASDAACEVAMTLRADGKDGQEADAAREQPEGETVWTDVVSPTWTRDASTGTYSADVELPVGLALFQGCGYALTAVATDPATGLSSDAATAHTSVDWAHRAPSPSDDTEVEPFDYVDESDGTHRLGCTVSVVRPDGWADSDVCDVYRVTRDGVQLAASGVVPPVPERTYEPTSDEEVDEGHVYYTRTGSGTDEDPYVYTVVDEPTEAGLPTYYELAAVAAAVLTDGLAATGGSASAYRVAVRTADGDVEWRDYDYALDSGLLRLDWDGRYVELPYDISTGDSFKKDFEARDHLGEAEPQGFWGSGIGRKGSLSCDIVRAESDVDQVALRALASYAGPVFVRTPDGSAYSANVDVSLDASADSAFVAVSLDAVRIALAPEHGIPTPEG